ncbi:protein-L-isoaspartate(D-aspartate) O-methyltransferase [Methanocella sp.]|uniref:protein-L-isoaspartate(D-aspartate) O-methyltransferase n=1 Tax=Methanocella sp. TaxID=2052833 RepID=UPI0032C22484
MIRLLRFQGISERVLDAMARVPRHLFVPENVLENAYEDVPLPIGEGQTISAPNMVAVMCDLLDVRNGDKVLEVGTGLGYHAAILSILAGSGMVYTVERKPELAYKAREIYKKLGLINIDVIIGDGSEGFPEHAPYDRISVAAAAPDIPGPLIDELKDGGRMVIPVGHYYQDLYLVEKAGGQVKTYNKGGVAFVPLVGKYGFQ